MSEPFDDLVLVGIGGGGARFVSETVARAVPGIRAVAFDSDATSGGAAGVAFRLLGAARLEGRGTGGDTIKGRAAAQDDIAAVQEAIAGARLAVVAVSLGGGFGSGAAPEILRAMRERGVATLCVATTPFELEGPGRAAVARKHLPLVEEAAGAMAEVRMDDLFAAAPGATLSDAIAGASAVMADVLSLFWAMLAKPGFIAVGVERMIAVVDGASGRCRVSAASEAGEGRAARAVDRLFASPLLGPDARIGGAGTVALGVMAGGDLRLAELSEISAAFRRHLPSGCVLTFGTVLDEAFAGSVRLVALFLDSVVKEEPDAVPDHPALSPQPPRRGAKKDRLAFGASGSGRFRGVEGTIHEGQDLDVPTYLRRNLPLEK